MRKNADAFNRFLDSSQILTQCRELIDKLKTSYIVKNVNINP
jgi:hypothetical protein